MARCNAPVVTIKDNSGKTLTQIRGNESQDIKEFQQALSVLQKNVNNYLTDLIRSNAAQESTKEGKHCNSENENMDVEVDEEDQDDDDDISPSPKRKKC